MSDMNQYLFDRWREFKRNAEKPAERPATRKLPTPEQAMAKYLELRVSDETLDRIEAPKPSFRDLFKNVLGGSDGKE
jgi:hypothetical protein